VSAGAATPQNRKISRHIILSFFLILRERSINSYSCIIQQCELHYTVCNAMENHRGKSSENRIENRAFCRLQFANFDSNGGDLDIVEMIVFCDLSGLLFHAADCKSMETWWLALSKQAWHPSIHASIAFAIH
jgi:hypothetical protein